jgi:hypothetical protein
MPKRQTTFVRPVEPAREVIKEIESAPDEETAIVTETRQRPAEEDEE